MVVIHGYSDMSARSLFCLQEVLETTSLMGWTPRSASSFCKKLTPLAEALRNEVGAYLTVSTDGALAHQ